jgi:hypothetical protein
MFRLNVIFFGLATIALAEGFTLSIGNAVASQDFRFKTAAFALRTESCADPAKAQISGTAEGLVNGSRRSIALRVTQAKPGVYAVDQNWPPDGAWVVSLRGTCAGESAGAIVPFGSQGILRESAKFFPRPPTAAEIEASLKSLAQGGNKK